MFWINSQRPTNLLAELKGWIIGAVFGLISLAALLFGAKRSGRNKERAKQSKETIEKLEKADEIKDKQLDAAADRPRDRDDLTDRMRSGRF